jgi:hypothetical protein
MNGKLRQRNVIGKNTQEKQLLVAAGVSAGPQFMELSIGID